LCDTDVLRLTDNGELERRMTALAVRFSEPAEYPGTGHPFLLPQARLGLLENGPQHG